MKLSRLLPLLLIVCLLVPLCLTSCSLIEGILSKDVKFKNLSEYKIVYETDVNGEIFVAVIEMIEAIEEKTGIRLDYGEDFVFTGEGVPTDTREILIGKTNREESRANRMGRNDYGVWYENDRLVITGGTDEAVIKAIGLFLEKYVTEEGVRRPLKECLVLSEYPYADTKIGKTSIYEYVIVRDNASLVVATALRDAIAEKTGAVLDVVTARQAPEGGHEIVVGKFADDVRTSPTAPADGYAILRDGDRLYLAGDGQAGVYEAVRVFTAAIAGERDRVTLDYSQKAEGTINEAPLVSLNLPSALPSLAGKLDLTYSTESVLERFHLTRAELPEEVTVLSRVSLDDYPSSKNTQVFVSPTGREGAKGTQDDPFPTLEAALEYMDGRRGGVIWLRGGTYEVKNTITVSGNHSGMRQSPLFIKTWENEEATFTTNVGLSTDLSLWEYLDENGNADVWERIPEEAREEIVYTTLEKQGLKLSDIAEITTANGAPRIYVGSEQYTVARYPNSNEPKDLLYFTQVYDTGTVTAVTGSNLYHQWLERAGKAGIDPKTSIGWEIRIPAGELGEEILSWVNTGDIWFYGSTFEGWEFGYYNLALTDTEGGLNGGTWSHTDPSRPGEKLLGRLKADGGYALKSKTYNTYGAKHSTNSPAGRNTFYLFNAIEALDAPGEWFLDRKTGTLYMYPGDGFYEPDSTMSVSATSSANVLAFNGAENVVLDGITVDGSNNNGISIGSANNFVVQNVTVRNTRRSSLVVSGTSRNTAVIYSDFSAAYATMVNLSLGASYYDMIPSNVVVQNCVFHDARPTVQTAVSISGCRTVVSHNYFHNTTTTLGSATECLIEYNRYEGGSADVVDGGMVYLHGFSARSNHVRYNLFHMFNATHNAVYNDGMGSGNYAYGNVISTLGSKSNRNKGWYSSTGIGNVCFGNVMILRNPAEVAGAGSSAGDEGGVVYTGANDCVNQSALFYYHFGNQYSSGGTAARYAFVDMEGNPITGADGNQIVANQSLAGHWWDGNKTDEHTRFFRDCETDAWETRDPTFINHLYGTKLLLDAHTDPACDYEARFFYAPWYLTGKTYTATVPAGVELLIPEYSYLDGDGLKTVEAHTVTVPEEGEITLFYEEMAAMERFRRQPAVCVISDNVLLGGRATMENGQYTDISDVSKIVTNDAASYYGYVDTTLVENNFFRYDYRTVIDGIDDYVYYFLPEVKADIEAAVSEEGYALLESIDFERMGVTYDLNYSDWWD